MDQVNEYKPPPNPTKVTDSRASDYIKKFGKSCWELDALKPEMMVKLIQGKITDKIDFDIWNRTLSMEAEVKGELEGVADNWDDIQSLLSFGKSWDSIHNELEASATKDAKIQDIQKKRRDYNHHWE